MPNEEHPTWKERVVEELRSLSVTVLYLWVLLSIFAVHREVVLAHYDISYSEKFGFALVNALILAKFMWLGEVLHAGKRVVGKPLAYSTIWNAALFSAILMVCHLLEEALLRWWHGQSGGQNALDVREILATWLMVFVVLIPFFLVKGLVQILGKSEMKSLMFHSAARPAREERPA